MIPMHITEKTCSPSTSIMTSCPHRAAWPNWLGSIHTQEEADVEDQRCGASLAVENPPERGYSSTIHDQ